MQHDALTRERVFDVLERATPGIRAWGVARLALFGSVARNQARPDSDVDEPRDFLRHILVDADFLVERSASVTADVFRADPTLQRALVRSLEILGDATKKVTDRRAAVAVGSFARTVTGARG